MIMITTTKMISIVKSIGGAVVSAIGGCVVGGVVGGCVGGVVGGVTGGATTFVASSTAGSENFAVAKFGCVVLVTVYETFAS